MEDAAHGEAVEKELDRLIERRALKSSAEQRRVEDLWREQERAHREKARRENRALWYAHEMHLCELHESLAAAHAEKARALLEEGVRAV